MPVRSSFTTLAAFALLCACAGAPPVVGTAPAVTPMPNLAPDNKPAVPPAPAAGAAFDPKNWVASFDLAPECEAEAYRMKKVNPDAAWLALRACVEKQKFARGPFTQIAVLGNHWGDELGAKADAPRVVARVIANRGGDVGGDLPTLQAVRAPVFALAAALQQPAVYKGRYVILRAEVKDIHTAENETPAFLLAETSFRQVEGMRELGPVSTSTRASSGSAAASASVSGSYNSTSGSGSGQLKASGAREYKDSTTWTSSTGKRTYENTTHETGRSALGRMAQADPFLQPGSQFIVLARFDGTKAADQGAQVAMVTIVAYFPPAALVVE